MAAWEWGAGSGGEEAAEAGADAAAEEVSTVVVAGLPPDATPREADNLCRFMPGFVHSKVDTKKGIMLFVRFDSALNAQAAIGAIAGHMFDRSQPGEPLRAQMARSNMRSTNAPPASAGAGWGGGPPRRVAPPAGGYGQGGYGHASSWSQPSKRPREESMPHAANPGEVDTLVCIGAHELGYDEQSLEVFFSSLDGFLTFKHNQKMGGGFVKFASTECASAAIAAAQENNVPAKWAKSSMGSPAKGGWGSGGDGYGKGGDGYGKGGHAYPAGQPPPPRTPPPGPPAKRARGVENPSSVDTVACVGALEAAAGPPPPPPAGGPGVPAPQLCPHGALGTI
ncbi:unnamed protein product [Prorocentrum cordatum]|uniref:RRM domain-containing protein n=1 Tax=Prorocentrum cordatum TaxID=2364126 RepID=A0ABN9T6A7_9DINO|nr:unnamed protein product [Polarella glacialis]